MTTATASTFRSTATHTATTGSSPSQPPTYPKRPLLLPPLQLLVQEGRGDE